MNITSLDKAILHVSKYAFRYILLITLLLSIACLCIYVKTDNKNELLENAAVEIFFGSLCTVIPIVLAYLFGKRVKELSFYHNAKGFLKEIKSNRDTLGSKKTQDLVIKFADTVPDGLLELPWYKKVQKRMIDNPDDFREADCGLCGQPVLTDLERCNNCKLNCFAWEEFLPDEK